MRRQPSEYPSVTSPASWSSFKWLGYHSPTDRQVARQLSRLREELAKLQVEVNKEKNRRVDLQQGESFKFLGFEFRRIRTRRGRSIPLYMP
jgi:hypothetical protein